MTYLHFLRNVKVVFCENANAGNPKQGQQILLINDNDGQIFLIK